MLKLIQQKGQPPEAYSDRKTKIVVWRLPSNIKNISEKKKWSFMPQKSLFQTKVSI
jgi:hypothetical protein